MLYIYTHVPNLMENHKICITYYILKYVYYIIIYNNCQKYECDAIVI